MIILRKKTDGSIKEVQLTMEQYDKIKDCISPSFECITCQLHNNETRNTEKTKTSNLMKNKYFHIGVHIVVTGLLFSIPFLLPRLHIDPSILLGASGIWTSGYSTYFAYRMDKEGLKIK